MTDCLKETSGDMTACAADWQESKKSKQPVAELSENQESFPVMPFVLGAAAGAAAGYAIKTNFDYVIPIPELPENWNKLSNLGMIALGGAALVGAILTKSSLRSGLLGLGIGGLGIGIFNGLNLSLSAKKARASRLTRTRALAARRMPQLRVGKPSPVQRYSSVQPGCLPIRDGGLINPVSQEEKYSGTVHIA